MIDRAGARAPEPPLPAPAKPRHNRPFEQSKELRLLQKRARRAGTLRNKVVQLARRKEEDEEGNGNEAGRAPPKALTVAVQVNFADGDRQDSHLHSTNYKDEAAIDSYGDLRSSGRSQDYGAAAVAAAGGGARVLAYDLKKEVGHGFSDARGSTRGSAPRSSRDGAKVPVSGHINGPRSSGERIAQQTDRDSRSNHFSHEQQQARNPSSPDRSNVLPAAASTAESKLPSSDSSSPFPLRRSSAAAARRFRPKAAAERPREASARYVVNSPHVGKHGNSPQQSLISPRQNAWVDGGLSNDDKNRPQEEDCIQNQIEAQRATGSARKTTCRAVKTPARIVMNQQDQRQQPSNENPHTNHHQHQQQQHQHQQHLNQQYESHSGLSDPRFHSGPLTKDVPKERIIHTDYDDAPNLLQLNSRACWASPSSAAIPSAASPQPALQARRGFHQHRDSSRAAPRVLHATLTPAPPPAGAESHHGKRVRIVQGQESRRGPRPKSVKVKTDECSSHYQSSGSSGDSPRNTSRGGVDEVGEVRGNAFQAQPHRLPGQQSPRRHEKNPSHFASSLEMFKRRLKMNQIKLTKETDMTVEEDYVIRLDDAIPLSKQHQTQQFRHDMKPHPPPSHHPPQHHHHLLHYRQHLQHPDTSHVGGEEEQAEQDDAGHGHGSPNARPRKGGRAADEVEDPSAALTKQTYRAPTARTETAADPTIGADMDNGRSSAKPCPGKTRRKVSNNRGQHAEAADDRGLSSAKLRGLGDGGERRGGGGHERKGDEEEEEEKECEETEEDLLLEEARGNAVNVADAEEEDRYEDDVDVECQGTFVFSGRMPPDSSGADDLTYVPPEEPARAPLPQVKTYVLEEDVARRLQGRCGSTYDPPMTLTLQNVTMHNNVLQRSVQREKMKRRRAETERRTRLLGEMGGVGGNRGVGGGGWGGGDGGGRAEGVWLAGFTGDLDAEVRMQRWLAEMERHQRAVQPMFNQNQFRVAIPAT